MKKKIFGFAVVVAMAALAFVTSGNSPEGTSLNLASLLKINSSSAECYSVVVIGNGKCLLTQHLCVFEPGIMDCDPGW
jgi:hypothetical protein